MATPSHGGETPGGLYQMPDEDRGQAFDVPETPEGLPEMKPEDYQYFAPLLKPGDEDALTAEQRVERKIMRLLLKVKNGTPQQRKSALRQLTDKARDLGAGPLFNQILPFMSPTLEDQERHLLVKVVDRVLYKLDELCPAVRAQDPGGHRASVNRRGLLRARRGPRDHREPRESRGLGDDDRRHAPGHRQRGRVRAQHDRARLLRRRAGAGRARAPALPARRSARARSRWQARHTGIKIVQQIAILLGCSVLPHLRQLVEIIEHGSGREAEGAHHRGALARRARRGGRRRTASNPSTAS